MSVIVRQAAIADLERLVEIWRLCGLSPWSNVDIEREFDRSGSIFLVAGPDDCEEIHGFILGRMVPATDRESGKDGEIYNIGVSPEFRRTGVGSLVLKSFVRQCRNAGAGRIWLEVRASNEAAIEFYRRHGFTDAGIRKNFYRDPDEDAHVMSFSSQPFQKYSFQES